MRKEPYIYHPYTCYCNYKDYEYESKKILDKWHEGIIEEEEKPKKIKWKIFGKWVVE